MRDRSVSAMWRGVAAASALAFASACSRGGGPGAEAASASASASPVDTAMIDSARRPVTITLKREALGVGQDASIDSVAAAMRRVAAALQRTASFDVLAVSPPILALQVRAAGDARTLAASLRVHPAVAAVEIESFRRPP